MNPAKLSLENIDTFLEKESDYTIRLLSKHVPVPKRYIFALLWFNGHTGLWIARLLDQNLKPVFEESKKEFSEAKYILIKKIGDWLFKGYKITALQTGYDIPPWLQRKR